MHAPVIINRILREKSGKPKNGKIKIQIPKNKSVFSFLITVLYSI